MRKKMIFGLALTALAFFISSLSGTGNATVTPSSADFGEVAVGSENFIPLTVTNNTMNSYILYFRFDNYSCGFTVNKQEVYLGPNESLDIEVGWTPVEETSCSATLLVTSGQDTLEEVPVEGTAVPPDQAGDVVITPEVPGTIWIGECDTGVADYQNRHGVPISYLIEQCGNQPENHGEFVRCVVSLANDLRKKGVVSQKEHAAIKRCAARSRIPLPQFGEAY